MENGYRLYSSLPKSEAGQKYARIDLGALRNNYRVLRDRVRERSAGVRPIAVVKADAYGHGADACVMALLREGCDFFAVSCIEEAIAVRNVCDACASDADILILGYTDPEEARILSERRILQCAVSLAHATALNDAASAAGVTVSVHVAVNTGMNRIGINARSREEIIAGADALFCISSFSNLRLCGMFTHFARADEPESEGAEATALQAERYRALRAEIERRGLFIPFHHVCNSAASVCGGADLFCGVRLGILLYGVYPSLCAELPLRPVMRLCARISHIYRLPAGEHVGYGGTYVSEKERTVAVLGIGYADGWIRAYQGARVLLHGASGEREIPLIGRICMDQCMADVTDTDAAVGDVVTLFGDCRARLAELSLRAGSIDYEGLCLVSSRVLRFYADEA